MNVRDIIKAIQELNPGDKHRLRAYLIDALTASLSTGNVLLDISDKPGIVKSIGENTGPSKIPNILILEE